MVKTAESLINELKKAGFKYIDINDLFKQKELPKEAVDIILKWFPEVYKDHLGSGDHLVRSLISAKDPFDPAALISFFESNIYNHTVMWGIAHVLATANTIDISEWIKDQLLKEVKSFERAGLVRGLFYKGNCKSNNELRRFLKLIFDKYPLEVLELFKKVGTKDDITFLEQKAKNSDKKLSREIEKIIAFITKKVERENK